MKFIVPIILSLFLVGCTTAKKRTISTGGIEQSLSKLDRSLSSAITKTDNLAKGNPLLRAELLGVKADLNQAYVWLGESKKETSLVQLKADALSTQLFKSETQKADLYKKYHFLKIPFCFLAAIAAGFLTAFIIVKFFPAISLVNPYVIAAPFVVSGLAWIAAFLLV